MHSLGLGGDPTNVQTGLFHKEFLLMLDEIGKLLSMNASIQPDIKKMVGPGVSAIDIDQTNKNPFGKILVEVESLRHFPY